MRYGHFACLSFALVAVSPLAVRALDITTCDQVVPPGETGVLQVDLSACGHEAVTLEDHASLQLNGHSITGSLIGIRCLGRSCSVSGPGKVSANYYGIQHSSDRNRTIRVDDVDFEDNEGSALASVGGRLLGTNLTVTGNGFDDPQNEPGIYARTILGTNLTVNNNAGLGIYGTARMRLVDSVITGNNGFGTSIDVFAERRPRLIGSTCGRSAGRNYEGAPPAGLPWGVCTGDSP